MQIFAHDGNAVFSGLWDTITAARYFDSALLSIPQNATHWVRYTTGTTAELVVGEPVHGATTAAATGNVVKVVTEQGSIGATTAAGILLLNNRSSTAFVAETVHAAGSNGTVAILQNPIELIKGHQHPKALLITVETASLVVAVGGQLAATTAAGNYGFTLSSGQSMIIRGINNIRTFNAINATNGNSSIMKYVLYV
jgi:hypothetical protein